MTGYCKLFEDIVTSTIWQEPNDCRVLWITMLALKGHDHICRATIPALAKFANISIKDVEKYLEHFQSPDKYSRSQEHKGRRIEPVEGGWFILNGEKYRQKMSKEDRKEQVRKAQERFRAKAKEALPKRQPPGPKDPQSASGRHLKANGKGNARECLTPIEPPDGEIF